MKRLFTSLILLLMGLCFMIMGMWAAIAGSRSAQADAVRAERLQPASAGILDRSAVGSEVLIEGRLSPRNRTVSGSYVAYYREEYRGSKKSNSSKWREDQRVTPRLLIEIPGGNVQLANENYALAGSLHTYQDTQVTTWNGFTGQGTKRYRGLFSGDQVVSIGTVGAGHTLQARVVFCGTRADYIAEKHTAARILPWIGGVFAVVGLAVAVGAAFTFVR